MARDINLKINSGFGYPGMNVKYVRIFSAVCIVCEIASIIIQTAALSMYVNALEPNNAFLPSYKIGYGIWGGALYLIVGVLGLAVTYVRKYSLLVATVVMSAILIFVSLLIVLLAAVAAFACWVGGSPSSCRASIHLNSICDSWLNLQWALVGCAILAFISSIALVILASQSLCTCCRKPNSSSDVPVTFPGTFFDHQQI